jgi:hypothetical protein
MTIHLLLAIPILILLALVLAFVVYYIGMALQSLRGDETVVIADCSIEGHDWSPDYLNTKGSDGKAACRILESYCLRCGARQQGSGQ